MIRRRVAVEELVEIVLVKYISHFLQHHIYYREQYLFLVSEILIYGSPGNIQLFTYLSDVGALKTLVDEHLFCRIDNLLPSSFSLRWHSFLHPHLNVLTFL